MRKGTIRAYGYVMPIAVILIVFVVVSVGISLILSFTQYNILSPPRLNGLSNYKRILTDTKFATAMANTLKIMIYVVPLQTVLSVGVAALIASRKNTILGKLAGIVIFIPVLSSSAVVGTLWKAILTGHIAAIDSFFSLFGVQTSMLLGDADTALLVVAMVMVWKSLGYYTVINIAALTGISPNYYEAAKADGAGRWQRFCHITLPMLKPTLILDVFLGIIASLQCFDIIYNLTGGGPANGTTTLVFYAYELCFKSSRAGYAMAVANVLLLLLLIMAAAQKRFMKREVSQI